MWNGGIEYGFMSFTTDRDVALSVLVFRDEAQHAHGSHGGVE